MIQLIDKNYDEFKKNTKNNNNFLDYKNQLENNQYNFNLIISNKIWINIYIYIQIIEWFFSQKIISNNFEKKISTSQNIMLRSKVKII